MQKWQLWPNNNTGIKPSCNIQIYIQYPFSVENISVQIKWHHKCHKSPQRAEFSFKCQIFSQLSLIWPKSLKMFVSFVFFISLFTVPCTSPHPVLSALFFTICPLVPSDCHCAWLAEGERSCCASLEHNSPSIPSFLPSLRCSILPFTSSHLTEPR